MSKDLRDSFSSGQELDGKSLDFLTRALSQRNLPDFDYMEFRQSVANLRDLEMDEQTAFRSAFATATTMGITRERLLETARFYRGVLLEEQQKFEVALHNRLQQEVKTKEAEAAQLKSRLEHYRQQIAELQQRMKIDEQAIAATDQAIAQEKERISTRQSEFEHTLQSILQAIDKDIEQINLYL